MRTFIIVILMGLEGTYDFIRPKPEPVIDFVMALMFVFGLFAAIAQDVKELNK